MTKAQYDHRLVAYAAKIAEALEKVPDPEIPYGQFAVDRVTFMFDGDPETGISVVADEHGGYSVELDR